ncbi:abl-interactor 1 [Aphelenchoides avenae]|nr:abl-interactor 1 [Aphelenchus avenae]
MTSTNKELRDLLDEGIPENIKILDSSAANLERVAAFCEANYGQSHNKREAFEETKRLAVQSLASVAYYMNTLSVAMLRTLDLEQEHLDHKAKEIHDINQVIAVHKEKLARREIGKLTSNKTIHRQAKISYPTHQEKAPKYQRCPIDYSILDSIGHGTKTVEYPQTKTIINRTNSVVSGDSLLSTPHNVSSNSSNYDQFMPKSTHTLLRNSVRSGIDHYRAPQVIPSSIPDVRYSTATANTLCAAGMSDGSVGYAESTSSSMPPPMPAYSSPSYRYSVDNGMPTPPATLLPPIDDDPLPPPPVALGNYQQYQRMPSLARALYDYDAMKPDELSLRENCIVFVLAKNEDGWYEGVLDGMTGLFPGNYVETIYN